MSIHVNSVARVEAGKTAGIVLDPSDYSDKDDFLGACQEGVKELMGIPEDAEDYDDDVELMFTDPDEEYPLDMVEPDDVDEDLWAWLELDDDDQEMVKAYRKECDRTESVERIQERYQGTFRSEAEWAEDYAEQTGMLDSMPENLRSYFDFESFARDCRMGGDTTFIDGGKGVYVFNNH